MRPALFYCPLPVSGVAEKVKDREAERVPRLSTSYSLLKLLVGFASNAERHTLDGVNQLRKPIYETPIAIHNPEPDECGRTNLVNTRRVQRFLDVSRSTLMRLIASRKIEAIKMDGVWKFRWTAAERFFQRRTRRAA